MKIIIIWFKSGCVEVLRIQKKKQLQKALDYVCANLDLIENTTITTIQE